MNDRLHEVCEIAASNLKSDFELYLAVKGELEVHLAETAKHIEHTGKTVMTQSQYP